MPTEGRGDLSLYAVTSSPRPPRSTDASTLSFPLHLMIQIVVLVVTVIVTVLATTAGLRSDIEVIKVELRGKRDVDSIRATGVEDRLKRMEDDIRQMKDEQKQVENRLRGEIRMKAYDDDLKKRSGR